MAADQLGIRDQVVADCTLNELELQLVARFADFKTPLQAKLESTQGPFTVVEVASILMCLAVAIMDGKPEDRSKLLRISKKLSACLRKIMRSKKQRSAK